MKIALYARVSTRDKGQNPDMQLDAMRKYCATMPDFEICQEYVDQASAADLVGRKAWTQAMKDASVHKYDVLFIWKLDRAFRSISHAHTALTMLNNYRVGFRSLNDAAIDTTTPNGMLLFSILAAFAEFERNLIVMRVNEGLKYARDHGTKSGKSIGRPAVPIPLQIICKAIFTAKGNYNQAAKNLSSERKEKINPGLIFLRLKRAKLDKNDILQNPGHYFDAVQTSFNPKN